MISNTIITVRSKVPEWIKYCLMALVLSEILIAAEWMH